MSSSPKKQCWTNAMIMQLKRENSHPHVTVDELLMTHSGFLYQGAHHGAGLVGLPFWNPGCPSTPKQPTKSAEKKQQIPGFLFGMDPLISVGCHRYLGLPLCTCMTNHRCSEHLQLCCNDTIKPYNETNTSVHAPPSLICIHMLWQWGWLWYFILRWSNIEQVDNPTSVANHWSRCFPSANHRFEY